jgi:hypothetical protein
MDAPEEKRPASLNYYTPPKSDYRKGATKPARVLAAITAVLFAAIAIHLWFHDRGQMSALVSGAGSIYCLLVAVGVIGKHKSGPTEPVA